MMQLLSALILVALTVTCTHQGRVTVALTERDYAVDESELVLPIEVTIRGSPSNDITVQVITLTLPTYREAYTADEPCRRSADELQDGRNPAESSDFDSTILQTVIRAGIGISITTRFDIPIIAQENNVEPTEVFLVLLNVTGAEEETIVFAGRCAIGIIRGDVAATQTVVRLDSPVADIVLKEDAGTVFLYNIVKIVETELDIVIAIEIRSGEDLTIPSRILYIPPEKSSIPMNITILDDELAEETESLELRLKVTVPGTRISQVFRTQITILDNEVVLVGFVGKEERRVTEGNQVEICADVLNVTLRNFERFSNVFPIFTIDGSARAGEDYTALSENFEPGTGAGYCFTLQTIDNQRAEEEARYFTLGFNSSANYPMTVIQPGSIRVVIVDNDAPPRAPTIHSSLTRNSTLTISWTAEHTPSQPINRFIGTIRVGNQDQEITIHFNTSDDSRTFLLRDFQKDKVHLIVVCAENTNGRSCSDPYRVDPPTTTPPTTTPPTTTLSVTPGGVSAAFTPGGVSEDPPGSEVSTGLIAGVALFATVLLCCCCLLLLFLLLCCCKAERERAYWPAKAKGKEVRGRSPDSTYSIDEEEESSYEPDIQKYSL